jgi:LysM repeat protein
VGRRPGRSATAHASRNGPASPARHSGRPLPLAAPVNVAVGEPLWAPAIAPGVTLPVPLDLDALASESLAAVDQTMRPTQASLWLRPRVSQRPQR